MCIWLLRLVAGTPTSTLFLLSTDKASVFSWHKWIHFIDQIYLRRAKMEVLVSFCFSCVSYKRDTGVNNAFELFVVSCFLSWRFHKTMNCIIANVQSNSFFDMAACIIQGNSVYVHTTFSSPQMSFSCTLLHRWFLNMAKGLDVPPEELCILVYSFECKKEEKVRF